MWLMESLEMPKKHIRKRTAPLGVTPAKQALHEPGCVGAPGWGQAVVLLDMCGRPAGFPLGFREGAVGRARGSVPPPWLPGEAGLGQWVSPRGIFFSDTRGKKINDLLRKRMRAGPVCTPRPAVRPAGWRTAP